MALVEEKISNFVSKFNRGLRLEERLWFLAIIFCFLRQFGILHAVYVYEDIKMRKSANAFNLHIGLVLLAVDVGL